MNSNSYKKIKTKIKNEQVFKDFIQDTEMETLIDLILDHYHDWF